MKTAVVIGSGGDSGDAGDGSDNCANEVGGDSGREYDNGVDYQVVPFKISKSVKTTTPLHSTLLFLLYTRSENERTEKRV